MNKPQYCCKELEKNPHNLVFHGDGLWDGKDRVKFCPHCGKKINLRKKKRKKTIEGIFQSFRQRSSMMIDPKTITDDFEKILKYLGIKERIYLHLVLGSTEGLWREDMKTIFLGIKGGYNRKLLIHECVHVTGKQHNDKEEFESVIRFDKYSTRLEQEIFGIEK